MFLYKLGSYFHKKKISPLTKICNLLIRLIHNSAIYGETEIGEGTLFGYGGIAVVIHKKAKIGRDCIIGSSVTIGGRSKSKDVPIIGSGVYIATGAKILGNISVGDNSVIGANAVVISDVPSNCVVAGIPAKVIKTNISASDYY
jgi:serine O-acetyltransferase